MDTLIPTISFFGMTALAWGIPIGLIVWFVRTLSTISGSLREISNRLAILERTMHDDQRR